MEAHKDVNTLLYDFRVDQQDVPIHASSLGELFRICSPICTTNSSSLPVQSARLPSPEHTPPRLIKPVAWDNEVIDPGDSHPLRHRNRKTDLLTHTTRYRRHEDADDTYKHVSRATEKPCTPNLEMAN